MYSTAAIAASPKGKLLFAMPSGSVMTAKETKIVQQRLSTREAKMENDVGVDDENTVSRYDTKGSELRRAGPGYAARTSTRTRYRCR